MATEDKVIELFFIADEFCKFFDWMMARYTLKNAWKRPYHRETTLSKAEIMLIIILFHDSGYRCFKHFYLDYVCKHLRHLFPKVVSYNRFVELEREVAIPLALFINRVLLGKCTGISFVDSTPIRVCRNQRIHIHRTFKGIAQRGKCSMGWFFGFKLHLICNEKGELLNFMITPGDIDDREPLKYNAFVEFLFGKLVGDKGILAKNFKKKYTKRGVNRKGREYFSLYAVKIDRKGYSLRGLVRELRKLLVLNLVNGYERKDKFNFNGVAREGHTNVFVPKVALTEAWIARHIGVKDRNTVYRLVKELEAEGRLGVEHSQMKFLSACSSDEAMKGVRVAPHNVVLQDRKTGFLYTIEANRYCTKMTADKRRFTNIIFNHAKRLEKGDHAACKDESATSMHETMAPEFAMSPQTEALFF